MSNRALYAIGSLLCLGGAAALYFTRPKNEPGQVANTPVPETKPEQKPVAATPTKTAAATTGISADELMKKNPDAIFSKNIVAKNDGSAIYTTTMKLASRTKKDEVLGKPFKYDKASNGTYNLKYQDVNGQYRIINSAAVKVQ